jgi:cob(I)alamin adenosyltransferase
MKKGLVHIYCGDGKGKTTAALGLILRAAGRGMKVSLVRLMKDCDSGELEALGRLDGVRVIPAPKKLKFVWLMSGEEKAAYRRQVLSMLEEAFSGGCGLLVIDEACSAVTTGMLDLNYLVNLIKSRPEGMEVVLTGREPAPELKELADYITVMEKEKHPFDKGIGARIGIEK